MAKITISLAFIFLLAVGIFFFFQSTYASPAMLHAFPQLKPKPTIANENTLSLLPNPLTTTLGKTTSVNVTLTNQGETPTIVQLEIAYDPMMLANVKVTPGDFYTNPKVDLNNIDQTTGRISYALSGSSKSANPNAQTIAVITFTPLVMTATPTTLYFMPKTSILTAEQKNTLKVGYGTQVIVK